MTKLSSTSITRRGVVAAGLAAAFGASAAAMSGCNASKEPSTPTAPSNTESPQPETTDPGSEDVPVISDEPTREETPVATADRLLSTMTLEQKVAQLFIVTPESLTGVERATIAGGLTEAALAELPVGGFCYFSKNLTGAQQVRDLLSGTRELCCAAGAHIAPFLTVDEEGGTLVARVANSGLFNVPTFPNMAQIGATGDTSKAAEVGEAIGTYLADIGFNLDFAPSADVLTNPQNTVIGPRSFGSDPALVASMVEAEVAAMLATGTLPCVKHFPGHGDTAGDSHTGAAVSTRSREEIDSCELEPFRAAIAAGCPLVMVGHIETPGYAADGLPASLSPIMMNDVLRGSLGFEGVIVSDSFAMGAITQRYAPAEAAVRFFQAGGDVLLMPQDLRVSYNGVLAAVNDGTLSQQDIDEKVLRVLRLKEQAGMLTAA
ncbi:glycoside hydrolase family 3 protein [Collinsella sp. An2]|uniref:glycoside hydrolase family 3 protein n=1 Tax=Collinsella sp. An2 TaxID=1965585 RepID=UPI000B387793|nr:glycoside hydrolase family 3 protein [Collinsella sp. An2]OUP08909.1 glycosyl hydrolase [Collinsella sp. An2]